MSRQNLFWLLGIVYLSAFAFAVSISSASGKQDIDLADLDQQDYQDVRLVVDVLHEVRSRYVNSLTREQRRQLIEDMLNGGLDRLDPHSGFIGKSEYKQFNRQSKGKFGGIGIQLGTDPNHNNMLMVLSPMPGTPADAAGVLQGDLIIKIDGKSTENMRISDAVELIQGEPDQKIQLTVRHEDGTTEDVDIVRAEIKVPTVLGDQRKPGREKEWDFLYDKGRKIGYVRLTAFNETSTEELKASLEELKKQGVRGLVLDLRGNPGGLLKSAREVSNLFLSEGRIVSTKGRNQEEEVYTANAKDTVLGSAKEVPMVVLLNRYSASASEIVAAALQDQHRAIVVGERSYGKGSVQNVIPMEKNHSALKLTTASYWRPSGANIHRFPDSKETDEWGVKPDKGYEVEMTAEERRDFARWRNQRDAFPGSKKNGAKKDEKKKDTDAEKKPFTDKVLDKAMEHLRDKLDKAGRADAPPEEGVHV